ncbi:MAG TPA: chemotaxis protein CheC [Solirubrobacteraceae bacterium]|nr:chemotaxis protein CheC [Solirubrobacteraceae bacterium]
MTISLNDSQLDALRELANIASAGAAGALSQMLAREVDISVPRAVACSIADAIDSCGDPEEEVTAVLIGVAGDFGGQVLLLVPPEQTFQICELLGVEAGTEVGESALREIGNILGTSYLNGLAAMTGLDLMPCPPLLQVDMVGALVASVMTEVAGDDDVALLLDSELTIAGEQCAIGFMLLPTSGGIEGLLTPLGLGPDVS